MRLRPLGPPPPGRCLPLLLLLALPGAAEPSFNVSVWPEDSIVEYGGSILINCSNTCLDVNATGGLETSLTKLPNGRGPGWETFHLVNITEWRSKLMCYFSCHNSYKTASANISLYQAPEQVVLEPLPELELGQAYNLTCRVLNVAPVGNLTVTLLQGGQTLHMETFQNDTRIGANTVTVTHTITPQQVDHGQEAICHTVLDLRPHKPPFQNRSTALALTVFAFPEPPQLYTPAYIEVGTKATARCEVAGIFPMEAARFNLSFGGEPVTFTITTSGNATAAEAMVGSQAPGRLALNCTVVVGSVSRSAGESVFVYSFPPPVLEMDQQQLLVNSNVSLTCRSPASQPPAVTLQLRDSLGTLASGPQPQLQLTLTARKEDNGRQFTCEGNLTLGSHFIIKNTSAQLTVLYKPTLDEPGCPSHRTWLEGTLQQLACKADGNPMPGVSCSKDGQVYKTGAMQNVTRGHAGVYRCAAANKHGMVSRNVTVDVEYGPEMDNASCARTWTWVEGTAQTLACKAQGSPVPAVICTKDGAAYDLGVQQVTREHAGTYLCNASNIHGSVNWEVIVQVEYKPKMDESSCPSKQTWLEGTMRTLVCEADGLPVPHVPCTKDGAAHEFGRERNVSRNDSGTYWCTASNRHGSEQRAVTVRVEYRPVILLLAVSPNSTIAAGANFSISCCAEGSPAPAYRWTVPLGPNINYSSDNSTVRVTGAGRHNSGVYECMAANAHGQHLGQVQIQVAGNRYFVVVILITVAAVVLPGGTAGLIYYLKSTACKKGEYNVQDAENSSKATCLKRQMPRDGDIYGIQLTPT